MTDSHPMVWPLELGCWTPMLCHDLSSKGDGLPGFSVAPSITLTRQVMAKHGTPSPQLEGPHHRMGVRHPKLRRHATAPHSTTRTKEATPKRGSPSPQVKGPRQSVGAHHPNSRGYAKGGGPSHQLEGPRRSVGFHHPNSRGHHK